MTYENMSLKMVTYEPPTEGTVSVFWGTAVKKETQILKLQIPVCLEHWSLLFVGQALATGSAS